MWCEGETADGTFELVITPESAGWATAACGCSSCRPAVRRSSDTGPDEMVLLPLSGAATVSCDGRSSSSPGAGTCSPGSPTSPTYRCRRACGSACGRWPLRAAGRQGHPQARRPLRPGVRGRRGAAWRRPGQPPGEQLLYPADFEADKLIAVEVLTPAGNWSSYPPHKHDEERDGEARLERSTTSRSARSTAPGCPARARTMLWATSGCTAPGPAGRIDVCTEVRAATPC